MRTHNTAGWHRIPESHHRRNAERTARAGPGSPAERIRDGVTALFVLFAVGTLTWMLSGISPANDGFSALVALLFLLGIVDVGLELWIDGGR